MSVFGRRWGPASDDDLGDDYWNSSRVSTFPKFGGRVCSLAEVGAERSGIMVIG